LVARVAFLAVARLASLACAVIANAIVLATREGSIDARIVRLLAFHPKTGWQRWPCRNTAVLVICEFGSLFTRACAHGVNDLVFAASVIEIDDARCA
tara:strand:+ start:38346 stop:38636 length:291 start_codon:yes stop_codon:yes gene_type:complete